MIEVNMKYTALREIGAKKAANPNNPVLSRPGIHK
jgi:hypothetical protein